MLSLIFFTKFPLLRRIINPFILIAESLILSKYLPPKNSYLKTVILSHALLSPSIIVVDAGFIATTLNYLWAVTFGLISLIPAQKQMNNQKISCFEKRRHSVLRMSSFYHFLLQFDLQPEQPQEHPPPRFLRE